VPGAPPYVVWIIGLGLILLAVAVLACVVGIALWLRDEARYHGRSPWLWFVLGLVGGWVTAIAWMVIRDRYDEPIPSLTSAEEAQPESPGGV
jgi:uncharacterized membrane protein